MLLASTALELFYVRENWIAAALCAVSWLLLPSAQRRASFMAFALLLASIVFELIGRSGAPEDSDLAVFKHLAFFCLACSIGRSVFLLLMRARPLRYLFRPVPQVLVDLIQALVYLVALFLTLREAGVTVSSLVTSSAILTALLGFLVKDTLGSVFAGFALQIDKPFSVGDWIQYGADPAATGRVLEVGWRTTKLLTIDDALVTVVNSALTQSTVINLTKPKRSSRRSVFFVVPQHIPPQDVHTLVLKAIAGMPHVVADPPPAVMTDEFTVHGIQYCLKMSINAYHLREQIDGEARDRIWYAFRRQGITILSAKHHLMIDRISNRGLRQARQHKRLARRRQALQQVDFLRVLPDATLDQLAQQVKPSLYAVGESLITEGDASTELLVLVSGRVRVSKRTPDGQIIELNDIVAPAFFGEMSLLTGELRSATVTAIEPCRCYAIDKTSFAPVITATPELATLLSTTISGRRDEQQSKLAHAAGPANGDRVNLVAAIRRWFRIRGEGRKEQGE